MFSAKHWSTLSVACALAASGTSRSRHLAARNADTESRGEPMQVSPIADPAPIAVPSSLSRALVQSIPAGDYVPFYKGKSGGRPLFVPAFEVAVKPVTRREYLSFVRDNPRWQRSRVQRLLAEPSYLDDWSSDLDFGSLPASFAVTNVSWFAAKAYCASLGQRLPSTVEWERASKVVGATFVERTLAPPGASLAASVWEWTADFNSVPVADGDPNGSPASLFCGAGARASDANDYAAFLRYSFRSSLKADFALRNLGFRCAEYGS